MFAEPHHKYLSLSFKFTQFVEKIPDGKSFDMFKYSQEIIFLCQKQLFKDVVFSKLVTLLLMKWNLEWKCQKRLAGIWNKRKIFGLEIEFKIQHVRVCCKENGGLPKGGMQWTHDVLMSSYLAPTPITLNRPSLPIYQFSFSLCSRYSQAFLS